jgi:hypothetical protein
MVLEDLKSHGYKQKIALVDSGEFPDQPAPKVQ